MAKNPGGPDKPKPRARGGRTGAGVRATEWIFGEPAGARGSLFFASTRQYNGHFFWFVQPDARAAPRRRCEIEYDCGLVFVLRFAAAG